MTRKKDVQPNGRERHDPNKRWRISIEGNGDLDHAREVALEAVANLRANHHRLSAAHFMSGHGLFTAPLIDGSEVDLSLPKHIGP
jgi:hypothetical protein